MERRELLGVLGAGAVGLATLSRATAADPEDHHHHDKAHEDCMKACGECARSCNETAAPLPRSARARNRRPAGPRAGPRADDGLPGVLHAVEHDDGAWQRSDAIFVRGLRGRL